MFLGMAGAKFYRFALRVLRLSDDILQYAGRGAPDGAGDYTGDVGDVEGGQQRAGENEHVRARDRGDHRGQVTADTHRRSKPPNDCEAGFLPPEYRTTGQRIQSLQPALRLSLACLQYNRDNHDRE